MPSAIDSSTPRSPSALRARVTAASKHANLQQRKKTRKNRRRTAPPVTTPGGPNYRKSSGPNRGNRAVQRSDGCANRSEEHTSELQSRENLVCRLLLEKKTQRNREEYAQLTTTCP